MFSITDNPILETDSYKFSHHLQYPPGTERVFSYIESRGGEFMQTLFFGLQAYLAQLRRITMQDVREAQDIVGLHIAHDGLFNFEGWKRIVEVHGGDLPLRIRAVPEGAVVPTHNALVTVENTDPELPWLTCFIETALLRAVWYPTTVATISWHARQIIKAALDATCDNPDSELPFRLHDFGARGVSSGESAALGGLAHLVNFQGSDTVEALMAARILYGAEMAGFSIPAAEHSTITSWRDGTESHEADAYRNMLRRFARPCAAVAVVSDSYDVHRAAGEIWGGELKRQVQDSGATVVIRPDSGSPSRVPIEIIEILGERFGYEENQKGFKVLPSCVRVIQGDGINLDTIGAILRRLQARGWSAENIAFGMGGALLQQCNRDTQKFAMKCSAVQVNGTWRDVYKAPVTDPGKRSKAGRLALIRENGHYETVREDDGWAWANMLQVVYENGRMPMRTTLEEVRKRAAQPALD